MKELIEQLPHVRLDAAKNMKLLDTCFIIDLATRRELHKIDQKVGILSFTALELLHVIKRIPTAKQEVRKFLEEKDILIIEVPAVPGDWESERHFVESIDDSLLQKVPDASDAVLAAAAIATNSDIYTKDKHHLFTTVLENHLERAGLHVYKELHDL